MSPLTTSPLLVAPAAADFPTLPLGSPTWTFGAWTEIIASTAQPTTIAGLCVAYGEYSVGQLEIDIGVGALGAEVSIGLVRMYGPNSGAGDNGPYMLRVPISGIPATTRVSLRFRNKASTVTTGLACGLAYYENFDSDIIIPPGDLLTCAPLAADAVTITPNVTPWANSAWVPLTDDTLEALLLYGIAFSNPYLDTDAELDLGSGDPGSEVVVAQLRTANNNTNTGRYWELPLIALVPVDPNVPVSIRLRKGGTSALTMSAALLYFVDVPPPETPVVIDKAHTQAFIPGFTGTFTVVVTNPITGSPTSGNIIVTDTLPAGLTLVGMAGTGWVCASNMCVRDDVLAPGASYPPITVTVMVDITAAGTLCNVASVTGGAEDTDCVVIQRPPIQAIRRLRRFALPFTMNRYQFISRFELILQAGVGLSGTPATVQGSDPVVMFRLSRDGGQTWDAELTMSMGKEGEYRRRAFLNRLGRARNPVVEITTSDPVFCSFIDATMDVEAGTS